MVVRDGSGEMVAEVDAENQAGFRRAVWNLRSHPPEAEGQQQRFRPRQGPLVEPGTYWVTLQATVGGQSRELAGPVSVLVVPLK